MARCGKVFSYFFYEGRVRVACHVNLMLPFLTIKDYEGRVKVACHVVEPLHTIHTYVNGVVDGLDNVSN
jgi:hypothetical protein